MRTSKLITLPIEDMKTLHLIAQIEKISVNQTIVNAVQPYLKKKRGEIEQLRIKGQKNEKS